ncbi:putative axonemal dynein light chain [Plasmopara halstedii]
MCILPKSCIKQWKMGRLCEVYMNEHTKGRKRVLEDDDPAPDFFIKRPIKVSKEPPSGDAQGSGAPPAPKPTVFTGTYSHGTNPTEDILNSILPPKEWTEDGQLWVQYVSSTPATRLDVVTLQDQLDLRLQQRQARETGICPVREELYAQCFDELIRQITVNCSERGLLLLRVRDEARMTIAAYQTLYESSIAFGMRKALMAEQKKMETEQQIRTYEGELRGLTSQIDEISTKCEAVAQREDERKIQDEKKHQEEVDSLRKNNEQLKANLEIMFAASK